MKIKQNQSLAEDKSIINCSTNSNLNASQSSTPTSRQTFKVIICSELKVRAIRDWGTSTLAGGE